MSNPRQSTDEKSEQAARSSSNVVAELQRELPPFQPFPAAPHPHEPRPRPSYQSQTTPGSPQAPEILHGSTHQHDTSAEPDGLPTPFVPFPRAPPRSPWAPPEGAPPVPPRPIPPPVPLPEPVPYLPPFQYPGESPYAPRDQSNGRPHICEQCETGFARAHDLRRHEETHRSARPHKCPDCQRSFSRKDAVQRHLASNCLGPDPNAGSSSNN
ncbi:hypothetical protein FRC09_012770 [Ceratobasidium sp. 395]|nr:hypothetical protein FRC09_012770 [Ceratobasidium sp. 395]